MTFYVDTSCRFPFARTEGHDQHYRGGKPMTPGHGGRAGRNRPRRPLMNSSILIVETRYHLRPLTARDQYAKATCWTSWILSKYHCLLLVLQPGQCPYHDNFTEGPTANSKAALGFKQSAE